MANYTFMISSDLSVMVSEFMIEYFELNADAVKYGQKLLLQSPTCTSVEIIRGNTQLVTLNK